MFMKFLYSSLLIVLLVAGCTQSESTGITLAQAKDLAFAQANVNEEDVTVFVEKQDDNVYEIEFYSTSVEYDFTIKVEDGSIVSSDFDIEDFSIPTENNPYEEAMNIAIADAGFSRMEVNSFKVEIGDEDGIEVYEVKFTKDGLEYKYKISVTSMDIVKKEIDDD